MRSPPAWSFLVDHERRMELGLTVGSKAVAVIKASNVIVGASRPDRAAPWLAGPPSCLPCVLSAACGAQLRARVTARA